MIYKPSAVSPNLDVVSKDSEDKTVNLKLNVMTNSKIHNIVRLGLSGGGGGYMYRSWTYNNVDYEEKVPFFKGEPEENNSYSYYHIDLTNDSITYNNDNCNIDISVPKDDLFFNKNCTINWCLRLYEAASYSEDYFIPIGSTEKMTLFNNKYIETVSGTFEYGYIYDGCTRVPKLDQNLFMYFTKNGTKVKEKIGSYLSLNGQVAWDYYGKIPESAFKCISYIPTSVLFYGAFTPSDISPRTLAKDTDNDVFLSTSAASGTTIRDDNYYLIKIYPHDFQTVYMNTTSGFEQYVPLAEFTDGHNILGRKPNSYYSCDSYYSRYYIKINGVFYKILKWYYGDIDEYNNPLEMYILVRGEEFKVLTSKSSTDSINYTIYCNYIDTDNYSFEINDCPTISFHDIKFPDASIPAYTTQEEALSNTPLELDYSNLELQAEYKQNSGAYVSKCTVNLYKVESDGSLSAIDKAGSGFVQNINYSYDKFLNGEKYLLHFEITNNRNVTDNRYISILPKYGIAPNLIRADLSVNKDNNSVMVDFGKLFSIAPKESVNENSFLNETIDESSFDYLCISSEQSLTYTKIDGQGELSVIQPLCNFVIRLHDCVSGEIAKITDDYENTYTLIWNGVQFEYTTIIDGIENVYTYYPYEQELSAETDIDSNAWLSTMLTNMTTDEINTGVPYYWNEALEAQEVDLNSYWHDESAADMYWWSIILTPSGAYFKNLSIENSDWNEGV